MTTDSFSARTATATLSGKDFTTEVEVQGHSITVDEPIEDGGQNAGPSPTRLLRSALAACQAITMRSYGNRKGWDVKSITVKVDLSSEVLDGVKTYKVVSLIELDGTLDQEQRARLREIATRCPVHRILADGASITTELV